MIPFTLKLKDDTHWALKIIAAKRKISMQELINEILERELSDDSNA